ncbi:MAG: glycosyltransferase [Bernardetiaceae bacterium]
MPDLQHHLHIYPSPFKNESRILKETQTLIERGLADQILILSAWQAGLSTQERIDEQRSVQRLQTFWDRLPPSKPVKLLRYVAFILLAYGRFSRVPFDYVNCHSLNVLLIGVWLKKWGKTKQVIYDTHELETERAGLGGLAQQVSRWLEKKLMPAVDEVITVCEPISQWYKATYQLPEVFTIPNAPTHPRPGELYPRSRILRETFGIPSEAIIFIYQGILSEARGIGPVLEVFKDTALDKHLVLMGFGPMEQEAKDAAKSYANIHFQEAVPPDQILHYSSSADVGLFFLPFEQISLSYHLSLPNKFFEYSIAGLYLIISDNLVEQARWVQTEKLGSVLPSTKAALRDFVQQLDRPMIQEQLKASEHFRKHVGWQQSEAVYEQIYAGSIKK